MRHSISVRVYLQSCEKYGAYNCLMPDLKVNAKQKLKKYIRMDVSTFEDTKLTTTNTCNYDIVT